ncbi:MAG: hypothetical protein V1845_02185 [bacterium]
MDQEILQKFEEQNKKLDAVLKSTEKTRKYFLVLIIISIAVIVLPIIGLLFAIPTFLDIYNPANLGL